MTSRSVLNALSIDVEDYFMVSAFEAHVPKTDWDKYESRVARNTRKILDILDEHDTKATFFTLGWIAERHPDLVGDIQKRGHEVASHGYHHKLVYDQTPEEFREDLRMAKRVLEKAAGVPVVGYRAPSFTVVRETQWALDILRDEGFQYDASIFPAPHARGGMPGASRFPYRTHDLMEFPMSTVRIAGKPFPYSGGGYFRLFPYWFIRWGIDSCNREGQPAVVYLHPWEFDPDQPRLKGRPVDVFKHYVNLRTTEIKLRGLLKEFKFSTIREVLRTSSGGTR